MSKNLIIFYTDQQRRDSLGCYGNPVARTPNIDGLAKRGVVFNNHYASNPVCSPSRASFMTGRHLQAHRLIDNGIALPKTEKTIADALVENGYHTCSVGKLHLTPYGAPLECEYEESLPLWQSGAMDGWTGPYYGFQDVQLTLGHGHGCYMSGGHYGEWFRRNFPDIAAAGGQPTLPVEAHHSTWVADQSIEFIRQNKEQPFFIYVSFPDPHHPFVCPESYLDMFKDAEFPAPHRKEGENDRKPFHYKKAMSEQQFHIDGGAHRPPDYTDDDWRKIFAATYGMVSLIDHSVGRVLDCLREEGLEGNTTIAYTSDHGDLMGDHHFLYKGPVPCRSLLNVPFIVADPACVPGKRDSVMSNVDAVPTLLDLLGVDIPDVVQGRSFKDVVMGGAGNPDHVALCSGWSKNSPNFYHHSIYGNRYRITYFPNQDDGELYDLEKDPYELDNLYHLPEHRDLRDELLVRLLKEIGRAEPSKPPTVAWW